MKTTLVLNPSETLDKLIVNPGFTIWGKLVPPPLRRLVPFDCHRLVGAVQDYRCDRCRPRWAPSAVRVFLVPSSVNARMDEQALDTWSILLVFCDWDQCMPSLDGFYSV